MHDTRSLIDTRRHQTNTNPIDSNYRALQLHSNTYKNNHHFEMDYDQNARFFRIDGQLRYHCGAHQEINDDYQ